MARKHKEIEEIFRDNIVGLIKGQFLNNPNIQYNSDYFVRMSKYDLLEYVQRLAKGMLDDIKNTEHLILDNGVKELQADLLEMCKAVKDKAINKDGECIHCQGEIPYGHAANCIAWKAEKHVAEREKEKK